MPKARHRKFKDPMMQRCYDHYRTADIREDKGSSDRRAYWMGREGYPADRVAPRNSLTYAIWAAGADVRHDMTAQPE